MTLFVSIAWLAIIALLLTILIWLALTTPKTKYKLNLENNIEKKLEIKSPNPVILENGKIFWDEPDGDGNHRFI